jgi:hypothetical protein
VDFSGKGKERAALMSSSQHDKQPDEESNEAANGECGQE